MNLHDQLFDTKFASRLILALQRAVLSQFSESDWIELGYQSGEQDFIEGHGRLLRSLRFGDEDYGACVFQALKHFSDQNAGALVAVIEHPKVLRVLTRDAPDILSELGLGAAHVPAVSARSLSATEVVERALADADHLLHASGPVSCVDRLHTALHGYLRSLCSEADIPVQDGASLTALFKHLRAEHPAFQHLGAQDKEVVRILNGFASVIDSINTIRNNASVAHPNEELLGVPEAALAVNVIRTLFHYVNARVRK
jgi:hypothetical protein